MLQDVNESNEMWNDWTRAGHRLEEPGGMSYFVFAFWHVKELCFPVNIVTIDDAF